VIARELNEASRDNENWFTQFLKSSSIRDTLSLHKRRMEELRANFTVCYFPARMWQRLTSDCPIKLSTVVETQFTLNATQTTVNAMRDNLDQLVTAQVLRGTPTYAAGQEAIPYRPTPMPSPRFTGRSVDLSRLRLYFSAEAAAQRRFLLYGMGGAGKTQICLKFAEESSDLSVSMLLSIYCHAQRHA
jgi:hypothetical protein